METDHHSDESKKNDRESVYFAKYLTSQKVMAFLLVELNNVDFF